jgi:hypothetical protein
MEPTGGGRSGGGARGLRRQTIILFVIGLVAGYVAIFATGLPILITIGIALYFLGTRRWLAFAVLVLLSPVTLAFILGAVQYGLGTADLRYMGLPDTEFNNLDTDYRCPRVTGGCLVNGGEFLVQEPHNAAVMLLINLMGPMRGSYDGPYPSREEALAALNGAERVPLEDLLNDVVRVQGQEVPLGHHVGRGLVAGTDMRTLAKDVLQGKIVNERDRKWYGEITAAIWQDRCLIIRIPLPTALQEGAEPSAMIAVIDRQAGRPFAYYGQGGYFHHSPPVKWKDDGTSLDISL